MNFDFFMGSHLGLVEVYSFEWSSVRGSLRVSFDPALAFLDVVTLAIGGLGLSGLVGCYLLVIIIGPESM